MSMANYPEDGFSDERTMIDYAIAYMNQKMIASPIGMGWDDLGDTVMVSDWIELDMTVDEFRSACHDMINDKLRDNNAPEELYID